MQTGLEAGNAASRDRVECWWERVAGIHSIEPRTKRRYEERPAALLKSWPDASAIEVRNIRARDISSVPQILSSGAKAEEVQRHGRGAAPRLKRGIEHGLRHGNPTADLKRVRVRAKELTLPSQDQFTALVAEIRRAPFGPGLAGADRVELLASGGLRQGEAAPVSWTDCDFKRREIVARGDAETGTKNGEVRHGPMIPDMVRLVDRQRINRPDEPADAPARRVNDCQKR